MEKAICFSVVTIAYNCELEIEATIRSVLQQTYPYIDYVIIDGDSSDGTMNIVEKYKGNIATVICEPDSGIYNAMNKGLKNCKGDYVVFMNAGDVFASNSVLEIFATRIGELEEMPSLAYGTYMEMQNDVVIPNRSSRMCWYGMFASHQSIFYNLDFLRNNGICYDESYRIAADYKMTISVVNKSHNILRTNVCVAKFDTTGISCSNPDMGLCEADRARREVLGYGRVRIKLIHWGLLAARLVRTHMKPIYKKLRY